MEPTALEEGILRLSREASPLCTLDFFIPLSASMAARYYQITKPALIPGPHWSRITVAISVRPTGRYSTYTAGQLRSAAVRSARAIITLWFKSTTPGEREESRERRICIYKKNNLTCCIIACAETELSRCFKSYSAFRLPSISFPLHISPRLLQRVPKQLPVERWVVNTLILRSIRTARPHPNRNPRPRLNLHLPCHEPG